MFSSWWCCQCQRWCHGDVDDVVVLARGDVGVGVVLVS